MHKSLWKKGPVIGIIMLFIGASVVPSIASYDKDVEKTGSVQNENIVIDNTEFDMLSTLYEPTWQWAVSAGGTKWDSCSGICTDSSGNTYITGHFKGSASFGSTTLNSSGWFDVFVAKLDSNGNWQWAVRAGGTSDVHGLDICMDSSSNAYITGRFIGSASFGSTTLNGSGWWDVFVAKLDSNGNWQWAVRAGGTNLVYGNGICVDSSNNTYITGYFRGWASFGSTTLKRIGESDVFVAKLDSNGNWQWAVSAGGTDYDNCYGICMDSSGNAYITGRFMGGSPSFGSTTLNCSGDWDVFVAKLSGCGDNQPPVVEIINPKEGYFHLSGIPLLPTLFNLIADTMSIGGFRLRPIQVNATDDNDEPGEFWVRLYINDEDKGYVTWNPETGYYEWNWTGWALGVYTLKVKAKDIWGAESDWAILDVWNFCFIP